MSTTLPAHKVIRTAVRFRILNKNQLHCIIRICHCGTCSVSLFPIGMQAQKTKTPEYIRDGEYDRKREKV